jgi:hypothetical protein
MNVGGPGVREAVPEKRRLVRRAHERGRSPEPFDDERTYPYQFVLIGTIGALGMSNG